jgi:flagellar assembly protein FliH
MNLHSSVERFAFDRIFAMHPSDPTVNVGDLEIEIAALKAEIALLKSEHREELARARLDGFEAGLSQARGEREVALLSAVDALHAGIEVIDAQFTEVSERVTGEATEVALAAADLLAGRAIEAAPSAAIDAAIGRVLGQVARGTELLIRVHPDLVGDIEEKIVLRQSQDRRKLNLFVAADAALALGDAMIGWEEGGLALNAAARREAIASELETLLRA